MTQQNTSDENTPLEKVAEFLAKKHEGNSAIVMILKGSDVALGVYQIEPVALREALNLMIAHSYNLQTETIDAPVSDV